MSCATLYTQHCVPQAAPAQTLTRGPTCPWQLNLHFLHLETHGPSFATGLHTYKTRHIGLGLGSLHLSAWHSGPALEWIPTEKQKRKKEREASPSMLSSLQPFPTSKELFGLDVVPMNLVTSNMRFLFHELVQTPPEPM